MELGERYLSVLRQTGDAPTDKTPPHDASMAHVLAAEVLTPSVLAAACSALLTCSTPTMTTWTSTWVCGSPSVASPMNPSTGLTATSDQDPAAPSPRG